MNLSDHLKHLDGPFSPTITVNKSAYLYFGGTAYLGIPQHKAFLEHYIAGIKRFGLNNGTSRNNNIQLGIYEDAEAFAAECFGAEAALVTSSGYLAAQLTVKFFSTSGNVLYAPQTHPSLWSLQAEVPYGDFNQWAKDCLSQINNSDQQDWVLISNALNNLFPERYDFSFISRILPGKRVVLIVDDSHGIGILESGAGILKTIPKTAQVEVLVVASMAKGPGIAAGIVLGSEKMIQALKTSNEFIGASPPAAAGLYAFMKAKDIYREERQKLGLLEDHFASAIHKEWRYIPGFPVFYHPDERLFEQLLQKNILISSFPYPGQDSKPINRVVLSSWHTEKQVKQLIAGL